MLLANKTRRGRPRKYSVSEKTLQKAIANPGKKYIVETVCGDKNAHRAFNSIKSMIVRHGLKKVRVKRKQSEESKWKFGIYVVCDK